ncbi:MAG: hypothetical protein AUJ75_00560 [Candidatus Omnitrophica bacterium CG1_02_49_10]|nr:MAG: hypothetical protein AUJ75_00560 [Candidatus Omnitrophica bacterium CG1_02_49_10]
MKRLSNKKLIRLCLERDRSAWAQFVERFSQLVHWSIKYRLTRYGAPRSMEDIEDIFQKVFLKLYSTDKLSTLRDADSLDSWLVMVASNEVIDFLKHRTTLKEDALGAEGAEHSRDIGSIERAEVYKIAGDIMSSLPEREGMVIRLNLLYGKKYKEIAELLDLPIGTIGTVISKAKGRVRAALKEKGVEDF